jgi:hypothetical protein
MTCELNDFLEVISERHALDATGLDYHRCGTVSKAAEVFTSLQHSPS